MPEPESPFREPEESAASRDAAVGKRRLPARKWSFVALGVMLFVLVWVRELTGLSPGFTIGIATLTLLLWGAVHLTLYTTWTRQSHADGRPARAPRKADGRSFHGGHLQAAMLAGLVGGIWLQGNLPLTPLASTLFVAAVVALVYGTAVVASRF